MKLKPCPFCGKPGRMVIHEDVKISGDRNEYGVECNHTGGAGCCMWTVETGFFDTEDEAAWAWNRRRAKEKA